MTALLGILTSIAGSSAGQAVITWLAKLLWDFVSKATKDQLAKAHWEDHVKKTLIEYEKVIEDAKVKALDGLTKEEIDEIRAKKIELEESLINGNPAS